MLVKYLWELWHVTSLLTNHSKFFITTQSTNPVALASMTDTEPSATKRNRVEEGDDRENESGESSSKTARGCDGQSKAEGDVRLLVNTTDTATVPSESPSTELQSPSHTGTLEVVLREPSTRRVVLWDSDRRIARTALWNRSQPSTPACPTGVCPCCGRPMPDTGTEFSDDHGTQYMYMAPHYFRLLSDQHENSLGTSGLTADRAWLLGERPAAQDRRPQVQHPVLLYPRSAISGLRQRFVSPASNCTDQGGERTAGKLRPAYAPAIHGADVAHRCFRDLSVQFRLRLLQRLRWDPPFVRRVI